MFDFCAFVTLMYPVPATFLYAANNLAGVEGGATAGADSKGAKNFSAEEKGHINEYAALMSGAGKSGKGSQDPLAAALFNDTDKASKGGCIVC